MLRPLLWICFVGGLLAAVCVGAALAGAPAGATAQCRDGTYSFSQHHSGTCSHHGGVAMWLDGSSTSTSSGSTSGSSSGTAAPVAVGATVLLARRTKTGGCKLGPNPDRRCSPGAYYNKLTKAVICSSSFRTSSIRNVPESEKFQVEQEYGLAPGHYGQTLEIDHIISLELGGSNDIANLYPEKANAHPGYHVKDKLENKLHQMVCAGATTLRAAQRGIASNWEALYKRVYGASPAPFLPPKPPSTPTPTPTPIPVPTPTPTPAAQCADAIDNDGDGKIDYPGDPGCSSAADTDETDPPPPPPPSNCSASYPDFCIPPPPPDKDCGDFSQKNFTVRWDVPNPDPHHLDGNKDGRACES